jgi:hypothetical protein
MLEELGFRHEIEAGTGEEWFTRSMDEPFVDSDVVMLDIRLNLDLAALDLAS